MRKAHVVEKKSSSEKIYDSDTPFSHLKTNNFHDVYFIVRDESFPAHRVLCSWHSPYWTREFAAMGPNPRIYNIAVDQDPAAFEKMLEYFYTGNLFFSREFPVEQVTKIHRLSILYEASSLQKKCLEVMEASINNESCLAYYFHMQYFKHSPKVAKLAATHLFSNFLAVSQTTRFLALTSDNLCDILEDDLLVESEDVVLHVVVRWLKHHESRRIYAADVLWHVRFPSVSVSSLLDLCNDTTLNLMADDEVKESILEALHFFLKIYEETNAAQSKQHLHTYSGESKQSSPFV
jgi:hypothetical protein